MMKRGQTPFHVPRQKRIQLVNGEIYHIVMRSIDGIELFRERRDYLRMIHNLFEFNDLSPVISTQRVIYHRDETGSVPVSFERRERKLLVEILAFCLMANHVHLLVRQLQDNGVSKFMQKLSGGYAVYYNKKYKRRGHLFQDRYRIIHIKNDKQLMTAFVYIHTNPVAILYPGWKEKGIKTENLKQVIEFLEKEYRWSSYPDYLRNKNFPSITVRDWLINEMGGIKEAQRFVNDWLEFKKELADLDKVAIE